MRAGTPVCVVSSGAIALGLGRLGREDVRAGCHGCRPLRRSVRHGFKLRGRRCSAAKGLQAAQILLTAREIADRTAYVNARNALAALNALGAVPVVNENDATATDEISFGDNDALAAQVAVLTSARLLVLLTEAEGVLTRAPGEPGAELIPDGASTGKAVLGRRTTPARAAWRARSAPRGWRRRPASRR